MIIQVASTEAGAMTEQHRCYLCRRVDEANRTTTCKRNSPYYVRGFKQAAKKALAHLDTITENTGKALNDVALTAMTGKSQKTMETILRLYV